MERNAIHDAPLALAADVAEFYVSDPEFRQAVEAITFEQRMEIRNLLNFLLEDPLHNFKTVDGKIRTMDKKFPPRKALLRFIASLTQDPRHNSLLYPQPSQTASTTLRMWRPDHTISDEERGEKARGNLLFRSGKFPEALEVGLSLLRGHPRLNGNPSIVGFVMNCYFRLEDYRNAFSFAEQLLHLEPDNKVALGIAMISAHRLGDHEKALQYAEEMLMIERDSKQAIGIAALAAQKLGRYEVALFYAKKSLAIEPDNMTSLGMAMYCSSRLGRHEEAYGFVLRLLEKEPNSIANLGAATHIAYEIERYRAVVIHGTKLLQLQPGNIAVLIELTVAYSKLGKPQEVRRYQAYLDRARAQEAEREAKVSPSATIN